MASYNRIVLLGNLTRDPQLSYTPSNTAVCKFGLATNHRFRDKEGNTREDTCFVDCTVFGRAGETFNQYMSKGRPVLIEGRLSWSQWTTPEGDKRSKHEVIVDNFQFVGGGGRGGDAGAADGETGAAAGNRAPARAAAAGSRAPEYDDAPAPVDDVPF
jgi:single-strand DNA-binding protein